MARQKGIIKLKGTIGDVTFYRTQDGHLAKEKTSLDGARIATDPAFIRTRENGSEFASAAKAGKILRDALRAYISGSSDGRVTSRLTALMMKIKTLDATSMRGARTVGTAIVLPSAMTMLQGFNFNKRALLGEVLHKPYTVNAATGEIDINAFLAANDVRVPQGATHISFTGCWAKVDFVNGVYNTQTSPVSNVALSAASANVTLIPTAAPTGTGTNIYLIKVEFFQMVNTIQYSLKNGAYNAVAVIQVA
ncbi:MAG: hypothetical protein ABI388_03505 [Bacteroidia bacterium]